MRYKIDPWVMESRMSMIDLQSMIQILTKKMEEDNKKNNQNGNKVMKSLAAIRDILNFMFAKDIPR